MAQRTNPGSPGVHVLELFHSNVAVDQQTPRSSGVALAVLLALFFLALLPYAANYVTHHPDERHYTDAAIRMIHSGDYLTPRNPDGTFRYRKPILAYWCVAASYRVLGISPLASRLPFLIAGLMVVLLTHRLAFTLTGDRTVAIVAALIIMCHPVLILSSTRSIPDILLCLFLLWSADGFLRILVLPRASQGAYWAAYLGCGLAVASKGLPALAFLGFAWIYVLVNPWHRRSWRDLVHVPSMAMGALVAFGWFAVMFFAHGSSSLEVFWADQVGQRVTRAHGRPFYQFPLFVGLCVLTFLPPVLPLLLRSPWAKKARRDAGAENAVDRRRPARSMQAVPFILFWALTYSIMAAMVTKFSIRYLLPICPLLAVLLATALARLDQQVMRRWLRAGLGSSGCLLALLGATIIGINLQLSSGWLEVVLTVAGVAGGLTLAVGGWRSTNLTSAVCLAIVFYLAFPLAYLALRHFVLPDQGTQLARRLGHCAALDEQAIRIVGKPALASKVRVCSAGRARVIQVDPWSLDQAGRQPIMIVSEDDLPRWDVGGYDLHPGSHGMMDLAVGDLLGALLQGNLVDYLQLRRQNYVIAIRRDRSGPIRLADQGDTRLR